MDWRKRKLAGWLNPYNAPAQPYHARTLADVVYDVPPVCTVYAVKNSYLLRADPLQGGSHTSNKQPIPMVEFIDNPQDLTNRIVAIQAQNKPGGV